MTINNYPVVDEDLDDAYNENFSHPEVKPGFDQLVVIRENAQLSFSDDNRYKATFSAGVSNVRADDTKGTLLERIDQSLYRTKE